jgi:hypothetical protein
VSGLIDSTLEKFDGDLRDLGRRLATLEAFRRQLIGVNEARSGPRAGPKDMRRAK